MTDHDNLFDDDLLIFAPEDDSDQKQESTEEAWKILIVDDEEDVHSTTRLVLQDFMFEGRPLEFISCYSGEEALKVLKDADNIAVILLDVVMESNQKGLEVVRTVRDVYNNRFVRIILRTGQPGEAPEKRVISEYDINDYKNKAELTTQQLYTSLYSALRSYRDLIALEQNRQGLQHIVASTSNLFQRQNLTQLARGVLTQIVALFGLTSSYYISASGFTATKNEEAKYEILAATGRFQTCEGNALGDCEEIPSEVVPYLQEAIEQRKSSFINGHYIGYFPTMENKVHLLFVENCSNVRNEDLDNLLRIFSHNAGIAFDNVSLNEEIIDTQVDLIFRLGEVVESRSKETAYHVQKVAEYTYLLAKEMGYNEEIAQLFKMASPLHDIGKIGIPDHILLKPGKLTTDEFEIMKTHTEIGYKILRGSNRPLLKTGAAIAIGHHERWDGNGYPRGLKEDEIHPAARIVNLADVYDALGSTRVYKGPWKEDKITEFIQGQRGGAFEPKLVDAFFKIQSKILKIKSTYVD